MRFMMKFAAAAAVLALATGAASAKEWKSIKIGTEGAYPPFNFVDSNKQLQGFDIEVGKALCEKMKAKCEFIGPLDWDGIIPGLVAKKYDAILASMSITEERKKKVDFTVKYYNTPARFVTSKTNGITDTKPEALAGKTIGAQSATTHATYLEEIYKPKGVTVKLYGKQDEANADLASGRLDAFLADSVVSYEWLEKDGSKCCQFVGADIKDVKYFGEGAGIAIRKEDKDLKAQFDKAIAEIIKDGTYEKLNKKYFPFSIY
jgi:polar amino acid transport system substrate-binding protein